MHRSGMALWILTLWHSLWVRNRKKKFQAGESWWSTNSSSTNKTQKKPIAVWIEKDGFKAGSRLDWKRVKAF